MISKFYTIKADQHNFFYMFGFFYLLLIGYFSNSFYAIYYIFYSAPNLDILLFWRVLFILFCGIHTLHSAFGLHLISFIMDQKIINYVEKRTNKILNFIDNYPFCSFLLIHIYTSLFIIHFFMLMIQDIDFYFEFFFQFFNLLRNLYVMPVVIFLYFQKVLFVPSGPNPMGWTELLEKQDLLSKNASIVIEKLKKLLLKYPKTSGSVTAVTLGLGSTLLTGHIQKQEMSQIQSGSGMMSESLKKVPGFFSNESNDFDSEKLVAFQQLIEYQIQMNKSSLTLGKDALLNWMIGNPSLVEEYRVLVDHLTVLEIKTIAEEYKKQQALLGINFMGTTVSRSSTATEENPSSSTLNVDAAEENPSSSTLNVDAAEENPSSSMLQISNNVPNSPLEKLKLL